MSELNDIALVVPFMFFPFPSFLPSLLRGGLCVAGRGACDVSSGVLFFYFAFQPRRIFSLRSVWVIVCSLLDGMFHLKFLPQ